MYNHVFNQLLSPHSAIHQINDTDPDWTKDKPSVDDEQDEYNEDDFEIEFELEDDEDSE